MRLNISGHCGHAELAERQYIDTVMDLTVGDCDFLRVWREYQEEVRMEDLDVFDDFDYLKLTMNIHRPSLWKKIEKAIKVAAVDHFKAMGMEWDGKVRIDYIDGIDFDLYGETNPLDAIIEGDRRQREQLAIIPSELFRVGAKGGSVMLIIKQCYFDDILAGTKTVEYRELRGGNLNKLATPGDGFYEVKNPATLRLYAGYNKNRDYAEVEVTDVRINDNGEVEYHLGRVMGKKLK